MHASGVDIIASLLIVNGQSKPSDAALFAWFASGNKPNWQEKANAGNVTQKIPHTTFVYVSARFMVDKKTCEAKYLGSKIINVWYALYSSVKTLFARIKFGKHRV